MQKKETEKEARDRVFKGKRDKDTFVGYGYNSDDILYRSVIYYTADKTKLDAISLGHGMLSLLMNRTLKEATIKKYQYQSHQILKEHLQDFIMAYNYAKRLKALRGLTPYQYIISIFTQKPETHITISWD